MSRTSKPRVRRCRVCKCTDADCRRCVARTGEPCHWVAADLCSACVGGPARAAAKRPRGTYRLVVGRHELRGERRADGWHWVCPSITGFARRWKGCRSVTGPAEEFLRVHDRPTFVLRRADIRVA